MAVKTIDELIKETAHYKHKIEAYSGKGNIGANQLDVSSLDHSLFGGSYGSARDRAEKYFNVSAKGKAGAPSGKFGDKYDEVNKILKDIEGLKDEVSEEYASAYSKKQLTKNQELLQRKAPAAYEKAGYGIEYHKGAVDKLAAVRDDHLKKIDKSFDKLREKLGNVSSGDKRLEALEHNKKFARQQVIDQFEAAKEFHIERRDALKEFVRDLEAESKIPAAEHMKKGAAQLEQGVAKELSAAEHAASGEAKIMGRMGHVGIGAGIGAAAGYVLSNEEDKPKNAVIGGIGGGVIGGIIHYFRKGASVAMGAVSRDHALLNKVADAATHMHR